MDLELNHVPFKTIEDITKVAHVRDDLNAEAGVKEPSLNELRSNLDGSIRVREQIDVFGGARNDAVCDQCVATGKRKSVLSGHVEGEPRHGGLERIRRGHQAAARARNGG
jgi:hypothetical protein